MTVMFLVTALASFVALATSVAADPSDHPDSHHRGYNTSGHTVPLTKKYLGQYNPVQRDQRRFTRIMNRANSVSSSNLAEDTAEQNLTNTGWYYEAKIGVGVPPTYYNLKVDTGSSNTWLGANAPYKNTNTSVNASGFMSEYYGYATFMGGLYYDTVTIVPGVAASDQPIGVAMYSSGISPSDGVLGIGPTDLTLGTVTYPLNATTIPTVTDRLFAQGIIQQYLVAVSFEPTTSGSVVNGELTFGAIDTTKYIGDISYFPITTSPIAGKYWGIDASIQYGSSNGSDPVVLTNTTAGIVDTGVTLIYIPTAAYNTYVSATGGVLDTSTGMLRITEAQYKNLQPLNFVIGNQTFELTPNAQIWPHALNSAILRSDKDSIYLIVQDSGKLYPGVDFVCGMAFLERFYSVFNSGNRSIGLARTPFTNATTN